MKMSRADKRRRRIAKMVEMKLDGMTDVDDLKRSSLEELHYFHRAWKNRHKQPDYYGASLADMVINEAGISYVDGRFDITAHHKTDLAT